jgi:hypothetical protein
MPFYKRESDAIISGGNKLSGPDGLELSAETKDQFTYPQQGWYWFDSMDAALTYFAGSQKVTGRRITKLAFRNRFTQSEKVAIEIAQLDDPAAPMRQRAMAAALRASQSDVNASTFIDLDRADTRAGVQQLEAAGLLAAKRALQILDAPIEAHEVFV